MLRFALLVLVALATPLLHAAAGGATAAPPASSPPQMGENFTLAHPGMAMIWVPAGTFVISSTISAGDDTEVTLTGGYWLGQTEVTQAQWQAIVSGIPIFQNRPVPSHFRGSDRPVERISWHMAVAYCARLTELEREAGRLPVGYEYALPTEAQWEYACRAGTKGKYAGDIDAIAWHSGNSGGQTHPVAQKQPNAWGFFDMHGNVVEWCADWYSGYPGGRATDPAGSASGVYRVLRGGSWATPAGACRSAFRAYILPVWDGNSAGFRVALAPRRAAH